MAKPTSLTRAGRGKLAPGSRLPPEAVRESQRERLMIALVEVVDRQGLPASTVADLIDRAHVSRAAFYEQFADLQDCFLATVDTHNARVGAQVLSAYNTPGLEWPERVRAAAQALQRAIDIWPAAARVCLADVLTAGDAAGERHEQAIALVRQLLRDARAATGQRGAVSKRAAVAATGALRGVLREHLAEPRRATTSEAAPQLAEEVASWLLACLPLPTSPSGGSARGSRGGRRAAVVAQPRDSHTGAAPAGAEDRRERIVTAVTDLAAAKGYRAMSHRDIASQAKVSYNTFYNHFASKQEAMLAACEEARLRLTATIAPALTASADGPTRVCLASSAFLRAVVASPLDARLLGVEVYALGHPGLEELGRLAAELARIPALLSVDPPSGEPSGAPAVSQRTAGHACAGAAIELLRHHASTRRLAELPQAGPELAYLALAPSLGGEAAQMACHLRTDASSFDTWPGRDAGGLTAEGEAARSRSSGSASGS